MTMTMRGVLAAVLVTLVAASCAAPVSSATGSAASAPAASTELGEQQHEAGAVRIAASWVASSTPTARVTLDTHSLDLDGFDLKALARLRLDGGAWVSPTLWDAPTGGHHRAGTLAFGSLEPQALATARVIELEVRDVGAPSHLLRWERTR